MANFTSNQVNHVLVANSYAQNFSSSAAVGTITPAVTDDKKYLYFLLTGKGGVTRSDLIEVSNIMYTSRTKASAMGRNLKYELIQLNPDVHTSTTLGGAYILNFEFQNPLGMSPDNRYFKHAAVNTTSTMTASNFYAKLGESITRNMSREGTPLVKAAAYYIAKWDKTEGYSTKDVVEHNGTLYVANNSISANTDITDSKWTKVTATNPTEFSASATYAIGDMVTHEGATYVAKEVVGSAAAWATNGAKFTKVFEEITTSNASSLSSLTGVLVMEAEQPGYRRGLNPDTPIMWHTAFSAVTVSDTEYPWGVTTPVTGPKLSNSKKAADLEWFAMGERADRYRGAGWPNNIDTEYMVDPTYATGYDMINIHYAYVGSNEAVQKSEKDLTIMVKTNGGGTGGFDADTVSLVGRVNTIVGSTVIPAIS